LKYSSVYLCTRGDHIKAAKVTVKGNNKQVVDMKVGLRVSGILKGFLKRKEIL